MGRAQGELGLPLLQEGNITVKQALCLPYASSHFLCVVEHGKNPGEINLRENAVSSVRDRALGLLASLLQFI
jgi:hypothetical protein